MSPSDVLRLVAALALSPVSAGLALLALDEWQGSKADRQATAYARQITARDHHAFDHARSIGSGRHVTGGQF